MHFEPPFIVSEDNLVVPVAPCRRWRWWYAGMDRPLVVNGGTGELRYREGEREENSVMKYKST